jgi:protein-disulfide isomerase
MTYYSDPTPAADRRPALALIAAGLLSGAALVVLALTLSGVIAPGASAIGSPATSVAPSQSASAAMTPGGPLVPLPPIAAPSVMTPTDAADGHALGQADAPVTVEVWADFQCPYCALFTTQVEAQVVSTYVETGQVRLVFRDLAFLGEESRWASVAAHLAEEQDAFWPYHDYLFANQQRENVGGFSLDRLQEIAGRIGLDRSAFDAGLQIDAARATFARIQADFQADAARLGISATPSVVVNDVLLDGSDWATVRAAVEAALAG